MRSIALLAVWLLAYSTSASPSPKPLSIPSGYLDGFKNPTVQLSVGGKAICISGIVHVAAAANNTHFTIDQPANQTVLTELLVNFTQINSTLEERVNGGKQLVQGIYGMYSELCFPKHTGLIDPTHFQFLIHGGHFGRTYWNNAPSYSYVDYAADNGYTTFSYDRLGVVIAHKLVQILRRGAIASHVFERIIGVGHSYGSAQIAALTPNFPKDFDALVLTGAVATPNGIIFDDLSTMPKIASQADPARFSGLSNGYYMSAIIEGLQYGFFRAPNFDPELLELAQATRQTQTVGEFLAFGEVSPSVNFTGPVFVATGEHDIPNCQGDCLLPYNKVAAVQEILFPAAKDNSGYYIVPGAGHGLNYHYSAQETYGKIHDFLKSHGF